MNQFLTRVYATLMMLPGAIQERKDERGASMTEYIVLVALIAAAVAGIVALFIDKLSTFIGGITL